MLWRSPWSGRTEIVQYKRFWEANILENPGVSTKKSIDSLFFPNRIHRTVCIYAYFRYVDDIIDSTVISLNEKREFLKRQRSLLNHWYKRESAEEIINEYENIAQVLVAKDLIFTTQIKSYLFRLLDSMEYDLERQESGTIFSREQIRIYNMELFLSNCQLFFLGFTGRTIDESKALLGLMDMSNEYATIKDLEEDIKAGIIKISIEDIDAYKLVVKNRRLVIDDNLKKWFEDKKRDVRQRLRSHLKDILEFSIPSPVRWLPLGIFMKMGLFIYFISKIIRIPSLTLKELKANEKPRTVLTPTYTLKSVVSINKTENNL